MSQRTLSSLIVFIAIAPVASVGCSSDDPVDQAGVAATGGAETGGSSGTSAQAGGGASAGSPGSGGSSMTSMTGGAPASGGASSTGGSTASGGMSNVGGSTAGSGAIGSAGGSTAGASAVAGAGGGSSGGEPGAAGTDSTAGGQAGSAGSMQGLAGMPGAGNGSGGQVATGDTWESYAKGFFESYCVSCHNDDNKGDATRDQHDLDVVIAEKDNIACGVSKSQADWSARGCTSGMPSSKQFPAGSGPKPTDEERDRLLAWIDAGTP